MSLLIGYARTSTAQQGAAALEGQLQDLHAFGCRRVFAERISTVAPRDQLDAALDCLRDGDTLVVTRIDRLARSVRDVVSIFERIEAKSATLRILAMNLDTATPTGRLMLDVLCSIAVFEREMMLERQREGIAKARAEGKHAGRKPTARARAGEVWALLAQGVARGDIAERLGISRTSIHRIITTPGRSTRMG